MTKDELETIQYNTLLEWVDVYSVRVEGNVFYKGGRKVVGFTCYMKFLSDFVASHPEISPPTHTDFVAILEHRAKEKEVVSSPEQKYSTVDSIQEFVPMVLGREKVAISPLGDRITDRYGRDISLNDLEVVITCAAHLYNEESKVGGEWTRNPMGTAAIKDFLKLYIQNTSSESWLDLKTSLNYKESCKKYLDGFVDWLCNTFQFTGNKELNIAIIKQWIWQTKRLYSGQVVTDPLMINFYSKSGGSGKTTLVREIIKPLTDYSAEANLDILLDSREHGLFTDRFVVLFDDIGLGKLEYGQVGALTAAFKQMLTSVKITQRNMRETSHTKKRRTFSPISTSNVPITQVLPDDSGMRRFFEIGVDSPKEKAWGNVEKLQKLDMVKVWTGVDENNNKGFIYQGSEALRLFREYQAGLKHRSIIDDCLENMEEVPLTVEQAEKLNITETLKSISDDKQIKAKLEDKGFIPYKPFAYRRILADWVSENMDRNFGKYLPGNNRIAVELQSRGYFVLENKAGTCWIVVKDSYSGAENV